MNKYITFTLSTKETVTLDVVHLKGSFLENLTDDLGVVPCDIPLELHLTRDEFDCIKLVLEGKIKASMLSQELVFKADNYGFFNTVLTKDVYYLNKVQHYRTTKLDKFLSKETKYITVSKSRYYKLKEQMPEDVVPFTMLVNTCGAIKAIVYYNNVLGHTYRPKNKSVTKGDDANRIKYEMLFEHHNVKKLSRGYSSKLKFKPYKEELDPFNVTSDSLDCNVLSPQENQAIYSNDLETFLYAMSRYFDVCVDYCPLFLHKYDSYKDQLEASIVPRDIDLPKLYNTLLTCNVKREAKKLCNQSQIAGHQILIESRECSMEVNTLFALYGFVIA